jgi:L-2-hydroxycarboxylate dehydrogenase (NAD+)
MTGQDTSIPGSAEGMVGATELRRFIAECMVAVGVAADDAAAVADVLVTADLGGIASHGSARLSRYVEGVRHGTIIGANVTREVRRTATTAVLDVGNGLGQPAAIAATRLAIDMAQRSGTACVTLRRSNHFGIAGYYARMGARADMLTIVTTNATPQVAPTHGVERLFGTNPIAIGLPTDTAEPFVFDAATSVAPRGRLERLVQAGEVEAPTGWAIDGRGGPATDLAEILTGLRHTGEHALLPLGGAGEESGGHKGFGLGLIVDLLCGPLAGAHWGRRVYGPDGAGLGQFVLCVNVADLISLEEFRAAAAAMFQEIRASRPIDAARPVRIAGDEEIATRARRLSEGISLEPDIVARMRQLADELGVTFPRIKPTAHRGTAAGPVAEVAH